MSLDRSKSRINRLISTSLLSSPNDIHSQVKPASGEYVMEVSFGTPPVAQFGIVDTGSDLIWTQCLPCVECYKQDIPIFNPTKSSSYKVLPCGSKACKYLDPSQGSCSSKGTCSYSYKYGDTSHTLGDVATETLTFKSQQNDNTTSFSRVAFGCGHNNVGSFQEDGSGLIGLGGGPLSLVSQLSPSIGRKFSYCLIPFSQEGNITSQINFGTSGEVSGHGVVSTPLVKKSPNTFYFLTLEGISVGKNRLVFSKRSSISSVDYEVDEGNIIIDSGTTLTFLPTDFFDDLVNALGQAIQGRPVEDPFGTLQLCYQDDEHLNIPNITAHFTGADVQLMPVNTFIKVSEDVVCFAMVAADNVALFGNIAQGNYLVGYDLEEGKVSFKPADCTKGN